MISIWYVIFKKRSRVDRRTALLLILFLQAVISSLCTVQGLLHFRHLSFQSTNLRHAPGLNFFFSTACNCDERVSHL